MRVSHKHRTASDATETFVHSHCELQDKMLHKKKRKHRQYDVFDKPKHCKYQKVKCDDGISVEESVHEDSHNDSSLKKHTFDEKLPKQLLSGMLQDTDNSQQQEKHRKKKKKMKNICHPAAKSHGTPYDADYGLLRQRYKNKRLKKLKYDDVLPHENLSKDRSKRSSSPLPVSSVNVGSDSENIVLDAITNAGKDGEVLLVNELADVSPDEVKCVEHVYTEEHKSSKLKYKQLTVNTDAKTDDADNSPVVLSEVPANFDSEVHNHLPTKTSSSEQHMNSEDVLKLLHAENSLSYLKNKAAVKKAGENLKCYIVVGCTSISCLYQPNCILFVILINFTK